ncbi:MAG: aromatic ring-hydroxylating dioxygenase subunit alpha [Thermoplasmata archaeon]|nr:aromatic ring-hydroxylating dioxygenase subunit alpha [Thermoplasmata archaeon]
MVGAVRSKGSGRVGRGPIDPLELRKVRRPLDRAATLPGGLFSDPTVYEQELERLILRSWQCIGRTDEIAAAGDFLTFEIGGSGVVLVRDSDGELRAFHNVCRHRGTRLVEPASGGALTRIQCPYHAWTYDLTGRLLGAPLMTGIKEFDREQFGLFPVKLESWRGFVFVNLDPKATPLATYLGGLVRRAAPYPLERLRRARRVVYDIAANWKLIVQNANECYHCPGVHPQLAQITPYRSGEEDLTDGPVFGGWMDFVDGANTLTASGTTRRKPFAGLSAEDRRRVYYYVLYPSNFLSLLPDYVTFDWFLPLGPERTRLVFDLYVDQDEADPADDAMEFWETTNRQDWHICEMAHLGSRTVAYHQGRYSSDEEVVHLLDEYYLEQMGLLRRGG